MGLDCLPLGKPKEGREAEFDALFKELVWSTRPDPSLWDRLAKITISPYETLKAPRVGTDAEADRWALQGYLERPQRLSSMSQDEWMKEFHGYYVLDLVPRNDGIPVYTAGGLGSYVDSFSFRGQLLNDCRDVLGKLVDEAWGHQKAVELVDYGARLHRRVAAFAEKQGMTEILGQEDRPDWLDDDFDHPASKIHVADSAARWCRYWGERGHGMIADF